MSIQLKGVSRSAAVLALSASVSIPALAWAQSPPQTPPAALSPTGAATAPAPAVADQTQIGEVVVTARRQSENLQDVPLTITAFGSTQLAARGSTSLADIAALTPGLNFTSYSNAGYPVLTIRGLAQRAITNLEENVSTFYGGIYLPRAYMVDSGLSGIDRVEVVEGPQSALYGRNAFSGAINYVPLSAPKRPTADLFTTVGNDGRLDYGATLGAPLIEDKISVLAGYAHTEFDGTWTNAHPNADADANGTTGKMGGWNNNTYFVSALITPIDRLKINLNWVQTAKNVEDAGTYEIDRNSGGGNCDAVGGVNQFFCGQLPVRQSIVDPRSQGLHSRSNIYRVSVDYRINDQFSVNYLYGQVGSTAYSFDQASVNSVTGLGNLIEFLGLPISSDNSDSHEVRINYDNGDTKVSIGGSTSTTYDNNIISLIFAPALATKPIYPSTPGQIVVGSDLTHIDTTSGFVQVSQDLFEKRLNLEFEGRYTEEFKKDFNRLVSQEYRATFDYFTPRLEAKWNFTRDNNVYVSAAKGVKSGGFNGGAILDSERAYQPEKNWTYEIGSKNQFFNRRLQIDGDFFYVDWSNLQTVSTSANPAYVGTITRNLGSVTDYGVELNALAKIYRGLSATAAFTYTNPTYGDGLKDPRFLQIHTAAGAPEIVCNGITCPADGSIGGNQLAVESKYQANFGLRYDGVLDMAGGLRYSAGGDVNYKSKQFVDPLLLTWVPAITLVNLNGQIFFKNFEVDVFAKNLFDQKYASGAVYTLAPTTDIRYEVALGDQRTFGMTLRYKY